MFKKTFSLIAIAAFATAAACGDRTDETVVEETTVETPATTETAPIVTPPAETDTVMMHDPMHEGMEQDTVPTDTDTM
jgi:hypothetical protein